MEKEALFIPGIIFTFFMLYLLIPEIIHVFRLYSIKKNGVRVKGKVVDAFFEDEEKGAACLEVHYIAYDGVTYILKSSVGSVFYNKMKGRETDVIYHKHRPNKAYIVSDSRIFKYITIPLFLILMAGGILMILRSLGYI